VLICVILGPGHGKAVSYVKYMDRNSLVSASTDSTLRLWDVPSQQLSRMYRSHLNEKNFVGLSVEGDFLACGSETGEVMDIF
jgi:E3 ubiquitin-protein ligase RFWD2